MILQMTSSDTSKPRRPRVLIKGAGDIASGVGIRLFRAGFDVAMTDIEHPTAVRRTVCFSESIRLGKVMVEDVMAEKAEDAQDAERIMAEGHIAVLVDPGALCCKALAPDALVDAILAKKNLGTKITDAPVVVAVGPGFTAGEDCMAVVETKRGHTLGRALYTGSPIPNTGVPGNIGGYTLERVLRAPAEGIIHPCHEIGDSVKAGDVIAMVEGEPMLAEISGVLRGLLPEGTPVFEGMKSGDIDPRDVLANCYTVSDKAIAVGGGVLEAIMHFITGSR